MNIQQTLRSAAVNGHIDLQTALSLVAKFDTEREQTVHLLKELETQVGMYPGEKINIHLAAMSGTRFNPIDYHYEKPVGEQ